MPCQQPSTSPEPNIQPDMSTTSTSLRGVYTMSSKSRNVRSNIQAKTNFPLLCSLMTSPGCTCRPNCMIQHSNQVVDSSNAIIHVIQRNKPEWQNGEANSGSHLTCGESSNVASHLILAVHIVSMQEMCRESDHLRRWTKTGVVSNEFDPARRYGW